MIEYSQHTVINGNNLDLSWLNYALPIGAVVFGIVFITIFSLCIWNFITIGREFRKNKF